MSKSVRTISRSVVIAVLLAGHLGWAQSTIQPRDRVREDISEGDMVRVAGSVHPALAHAASEARVDASFPMEHMILLLQPDDAQQAALDQLVAEQHDPQSPQYHQFLTPEQYAAHFGVSPNDIDKVTGWLKQQGFRVEEVTPNHRSIIFSGDAYAVENAFKTEVKQYSVNGEVHHANASDPQIPAALAGVVKGVVKLHDFRAKSFNRGFRAVTDASHPTYTASPTTHYMGPADFAQIYDVRPLYTGNLNGSGQSIAVIGRSNVNSSDVASFRAQFGLPASLPTVIVAQGSNPGFTNDGDSTEATLDVEWAGAVAPQAQVKFVISSSTAAADGIDLAAMYAVNHNVAPVLSVSFGSCEADMGSLGPSGGSTELAFYNSLWQQAAAQGISVFVAAGDAGAAGCDSSTATAGSSRAVNGICSSPYATCVGGTEFHEGSDPAQYWLGGNNSVLGTAQSYIPEVVWNESGSNGGSGLAAGGGGASTQWTKPSWQIGPGVPADGHRDVPDVALSAAVHDGYLIFYNGSLGVVGGTSASAPSFAGLFAIINQKWASTQGNANPVFYPLAIKQAQGGALVFHDITSGNNTVPGVAGYSAAAGFDLASGLGSVDALQLVNHWHDVSLNGTFTLTTASATASAQAGQNVSVNASVAVSNGFNWPVALTVSGAPSGITASFNEPTVPAPGSGTVSLLLATNNTVAAGSYPITITATGGTISKTATVTLTVTAIVPKCTLTATPATITLTVPQATNVRLTCASPQGTLPATLTLSASGQSTGITTSFSPATLVPSTGTSSLTITTSTAAPVGTHSLSITASGGSYSQTISLPVTVAVAPSFALTLGSGALSVMQATTGPVNVNIADVGTFSSATSLSLSNLPSGMTGSFSIGSFAAPGAGTSTLTLQPSLSTPPGSYSINIVGSGGGLVKSIPLAVTVTAAPSFTFALSTPVLDIQAGQAAGQVTMTIKNLTANFNAPVNFSITGLPTGVISSLSASTLPAPGSGTSTLSLSAPVTVTPGQYKVTITAAGGVVSQSATLQLTVIGIPGFTLKTDVTTLSLTAGATFTTTVGIVAQNGFNSSVTLALGTLPVGVTAALSSNTITGPTATVALTIQTASTIANGSYSIPLSGTSSVIATALPSQTTNVAITIGSVHTALSSSSVTIARSHTAGTGLTVAATNFTGAVTFSLSGLPPYISCTFSPTSFAGSGSTSLNLIVGASAATGTYVLQVRTGAGGTTSQVPLQLIVQ